MCWARRARPRSARCWRSPPGLPTRCRSRCRSRRSRWRCVSVAALVALAGPQASLLTLLLAGLALSSLAGALISLTLNLAPSLYAALEITFWLLGSLEDRSFRHVAIAAPFMALAACAAAVDARPLAALSLGEDVARSSGVDLDAPALADADRRCGRRRRERGGRRRDRLRRARRAASRPAARRPRSRARACAGDAGGRRPAAGGGLRWCGWCRPTARSTSASSRR